MTPQQWMVGEAHRDFHAERFRYANVRSWREPWRTLGGKLPLVPASFDLWFQLCGEPLPDKLGRGWPGCGALLKPVVASSIFRPIVLRDRARNPRALLP